MNKKSGLSISLILIIFLGFANYLNSLKGEFVWDDNFLIKDNVYIKSWSNIPEIFTKDIGAGTEKRYYFYRPIQMLTYMIDYSIWKLNVIGYHLSSLLLHILASLVLWWLINLLFKDHLLALLTGLLFVSHPIHTEAVSYISGRADSLALLFMLLCLIFYIKFFHLESKKFYILMFLSYILALPSRENSLILPGLILLYHYTFKKKLKYKAFLALLSIAFVYILLRLTLLRGLLPHFQASTTILQRIPGFCIAITNYGKLLILPFNLHMEYGKPLFHLNSPKAIIGLLILFSSILYLFRKGKKDLIISFSLAWFFITLIPVSNLYPINAYMAEHWLYVPSIGFFLIVARYISRIYRTKNLRMLSILFGTALLVFYSFITVRQNNYWKKSISIYEKAIQYAPDSVILQNNLAMAYHNLKEDQKATSLIEKAIKINPDNANTYNNLGIIYEAMAKKEEAIAAYKKAIEISSDNAKAYNNLGLLYHKIGEDQKATDLIKKAMKLNPRYPETYNNLGLVYYAMDRKEEAIQMFKKALELNPYYPQAYNNLGLVYYNTGDNPKAIAFIKKATELNPNYVDAYFNLGNAYSSAGRYPEAIAIFKKAVELNPRYLDTYNNLGFLYNIFGKKEEAIASFKKTVEIDPQNPEAYNNLGLAYQRIKNYPEAIASFKKAIELKPRHPSAYNNLGMTYYSLGEEDQALASFKKAIELDPDYAIAHYNLGIAYINMGEEDQALASFKKAIELDPDYAEAYNNLGFIYYSLGEEDQALASFKKAIELDPDYADAYNNLGLAYYSLGKKEEAMDAYKKAIGINPNLARAHNNLAILYYYEKQYDLAIKHFDAAIRLGYKVDNKILETLKPYRR